MLKLIESWKGAVEVDGVKYDSIQALTSSSKTFSDKVHIVLHASAKNVTEKRTASEKQSIEASTDRTEYRITVKKYMTQPSSGGFDFMLKWNKNKPMPCVTMRGTVEKETRGMVYMNYLCVLWKRINESCLTILWYWSNLFRKARYCQCY